MTPDADINAFIWSMENNQFTFNSGNKSNIDFISNRLAQNRLLKSSSSQHTITPLVRNLCKNLDDDLSHLLSDIEFNSNAALLTKSVSLARMSDVISEDFDRFNEYLHVDLKQFCQRLSSSLLNLIESQQQVLNETLGHDLTLISSPGVNLIIKRILLICRFVNAVINLSCPHLKACFNNVNQQFIQQRRSQLVSKLADPGESTFQLKKKLPFSEQKVNFHFR